jgi:hypothetical protein
MQSQWWLDDTTGTHHVMLFQQLLKPHDDAKNHQANQRFHNQQQQQQQQQQHATSTRIKVTIFTIKQTPSSPPRTTFLKPSIRIDQSLSKRIPWFSRLFFACVNGCVVAWIPGCVFTVLAMNFSHPCIGGFAFDSFRCG